MKIPKSHEDVFGAFRKKTRVSTLAANGDQFAAWPVQVDIFKASYPDAQDMFSHVEDLWMRLARYSAIHCAVKTNATTGVRLVMFRQLPSLQEHEVDELLQLVASHKTYAWQGAHAVQCLVQRIEWCGDVLVIELASSRQLARDIDGEALDWQLCSLTMKMQRARSAR